ncbi:MAG: hypothetical protein LHW44_06960 [Candidatus Cloacimonetes bacterium]|nr:hypothetical protein [Candidatus Cloacimonadota bacterium]
MSVILDVMAAVVLGSILLLMMITFQYNLREATDRALYTKQMLDHMDLAAYKLNGVVALAGIGFEPNEMVVHARPDSLVFNTYWDYQNNILGTHSNTLSISLSPMPSPYGKALVIRQNGVPLNDLGHIFWVDRLRFVYHDRDGRVTTDRTKVRDTNIYLTFFRDPPRAGGQTLRNNLEIKCFFMNAFMRGA